MQKIIRIVFVVIFLFVITKSSFAANAFSDVPKNHWSYIFISQLAKEGIIEGYVDGTYVGEKNMTRYEMAQIIAKAMARCDEVDATQKAKIERLASEFSEELDALGVRVSNIEKQTDNIKVTGEARFGHWSYDKDDDETILRSRVWITGSVNERWSYAGMFQNQQNLETNKNESKLELRRAWVRGALGSIDVQAGRFFYSPVNGIVHDLDVDGIKLSYKEKSYKFDVFALRPFSTNKAMIHWHADTKDSRNNQVYGTVFSYDANKLNIKIAYYHAKPSGKGGKNSNINEISLEYSFNNYWSWWGEYIHGSNNVNKGGKSGWATQLNYGQVDRKKKGSFNLNLAYYDVPASVTFSTGPELDLTERPVSEYDGYKGWGFGGRVMIDKNIDFNVEYFDFKAQKGSYSNDLLWTYVRFYF